MKLFGADSYKSRYVLKLWNSLPWDIGECQKHKWTQKGITRSSRIPPKAKHRDKCNTLSLNHGLLEARKLSLHAYLLCSLARCSILVTTRDRVFD